MKLLLLFVVMLQFLPSLYSDNVETKEEVVNDPLLPKQTIQEVDNKQNSFVEDWEQMMADYEHESIFTIKLKAGETQIFYEEVTELNKIQPVRGAFIINEESTSLSVLMTVYQEENLIYSSESKEKIFKFNTAKEGVVAIKLFNMNSQDILLTFTISPGTESIAKKEHLSFSEKKLDNLLLFLRNFKLEKIIFTTRNEERNKEFRQMSRNFYGLTVIESLVLLGITVLQFYFIKSLFEVKSSF